MLECLNDWMREWMMNIDYRMTSASSMSNVECPTTNAQVRHLKIGHWVFYIDYCVPQGRAASLRETFVHSFRVSSIRACLSADRHSWPTIRWVKTAPKKMINWMINIEHRLLNTKGPSFWTSAAEARMVKNLPLWIPIYPEDSSVTLFDRFLRMTLKRVSLYNFHFPLYTLLP